MATYTLNYKLKKPAASEYYNIQDFNDNADTIDAKLKLGEDAKTLAESLNTNMASAKKEINTLLQKSVISVEVWAPPNTQVILEQGELSFVGTVGGTMELMASVSSLGKWEMTYVYANKTYFKDIRVDNIGYNRVVAAPTLAASPWEYIAKLSEAGLAREAYVLGDTKSVTSSLGTYDVQIIGFDHDFYSTPKPGRERAGITFQMKSTTGMDYIIDSNPSFPYNWEQTNMRTVQLPAILQSMPGPLQNAVKLVRKFTAQTNGIMGCSTNDYLFLFSDYELCGKSVSITDFAYTQQYEYYRSGHTPYKTNPYWLRNNLSGPNARENFLAMGNDNLAPSISRCDNKKAVCLGFCV